MNAASIGMLKLSGIIDTKRITKGLTDLRTRISSIIPKMSINKGLMGLAAGLSATAVAADSFRTTVDMGKLTLGLAKATGLAGEELTAMRDTLFDLSTEMKGVDTASLMEIATSGSKMGIANKDLREYSRNVALISLAIDDMEAGEISAKIGQLNNIFKLSATEGPAQLGSMLDKVADSGAAMASDLINTTSRIAGVANSAGISSAETIGLAMALIETGTEAQAAGGSIKRFISQLTKASNADTLSEITGIQDFSTLMANNPFQAVSAFLDKMRQQDFQGQQEILGKIGLSGSEDIGNLPKLAANYERLGMFVGRANKEFKTLQQLKDTETLTNESVGASLTQISNKFTVLKNTIGEQFAPSLMTAMTLMGDFAVGLGRVIQMSNKTDNQIGEMSNSVSTLGVSFRNLDSIIKHTVVRIAKRLHFGMQAMVNLFEIHQNIMNLRNPLENLTTLPDNYDDLLSSIEEEMFNRELDIIANVEPVITDKVKDAIPDFSQMDMGFDTPKTETPDIGARETRIGANLSLGSAEAISALNQFRAQFQRNDANDKIAKNTNQSNLILNKIEKGINKLVGNTLEVLSI